MKINRRINVHCSAGYGNVKSMQAWWRSLGWKVDGYNYVIDLDGTIHPLVPEDQVSNGVKGYNSDAINICYIGGVEKDNYSKAKDTRTPEQKESIICLIELLLERYPTITIIKGHRDYSPDKNGNGVIDPWERIKECPSFDAIPEYKYLLDKFKR